MEQKAHIQGQALYVRPARQTARTIESPGCFAPLRSEQRAAPGAPLSGYTNAILREAKQKIAVLIDWLKEVKAELSKPQPPTLAELLSAIYVDAPGKSGGKRVQHIHIKYGRPGFIPLNELMQEETA